MGDSTNRHPLKGNCAEENYAVRLEKPNQPMRILGICGRNDTHLKIILVMLIKCDMIHSSTTTKD
jgi:hypothetical protein